MIDLSQPKEQLDLLRFIHILDERIQSLEQDVKAQEETLASQASMLRALKRQKQMLFEVEDEEWIHVNECANYCELPQPSTVREWIRNGLLKENVDYRKVGPRGKVYINATKVVAKTKKG
jgi:hypothetical protein